MANTKISNLTALSSPATDDVLAIVDTSAGQTKKITYDNFFNRSVGIGVGAQAGQQLTAKADGASTISLVADTAASPSKPVMELRENGITRLFFIGSAGGNHSSVQVLTAAAIDNGTGAANGIYLDRNENASTPAAGHMWMRDKGNTGYYWWPDDSGKARIGTSQPNNANDTSGSVIGDQSSWHEGKINIEQVRDTATALARIVDTDVYQWQYEETSYKTPDGGPQTFTGVVGYSKDDWFLKNVGPKQEPALNEITLFGNLILAVQELDRRLTRLEN